LMSNLGTKNCVLR